VHSFFLPKMGHDRPFGAREGQNEGSRVEFTLIDFTKDNNTRELCLWIVGDGGMEEKHAYLPSSARGSEVVEDAE